MAYCTCGTLREVCSILLKFSIRREQLWHIAISALLFENEMIPVLLTSCWLYHCIQVIILIRFSLTA